MNQTNGNQVGRDARKLVLLPINLVLAPLSLIAVATGRMSFRKWVRLCVTSLPCVS